jgi:uncharacterized protein DUF4255
MATYNAIAAVGRTILGLLEEYYPRTLLVNPQFALYQAANFEDPMAEGFSLYLYRVSINAGGRNLPARLTPENKRLRPSLPIDIYYLISPWAANCERQHRLLGWTMRFLEDNAVLPSGLLNHYVPETDTFHPGETIEIVCDPLALSDHLNLWDKLKPKMETSLTYAVRMVLIDSEVESPEAALVQTRHVDAGEVIA